MSSKRFRSFIAITIVAIMTLCNAAPLSAAVEGAAKTVTVLGFNDFHGSLEEASGETGNPGAAKLVGSMLELIAENKNGTIVVAAGDNYQGSALSNLNNGKPVSDMLKLIGAKYSAIGNHEFDWTRDLFAGWQKDGGFQFLAANIVYKDTQEQPEFAIPYAVEEVDGVKIGFIGLITMETPGLVTAANIADLDFTDPIEAAKKYYTVLKEEENCDAIIALTHLGVEQDEDEIITGEAAKLAEAMPELNGIIAGHSHRQVNGYVNGVPIVQGHYNGRCISRLDISVDENGEVIGTEPSLVVLSSAEAKAAAPVNEDMAGLTSKYIAELEPILAEVVGHSDIALQTKPEVAAWACELLYDYLLRVEGKPYIVMQNNGGWRSGGIPLPEGDITMSYMYGLMPFDNSMVVMEVTGEELISIIERPDEELISTLDFYGTAARDGKYYMLYDGSQVTADGIYNIMCNDFMYTGGDKFDFSAGRNVEYLGMPLRDAMVEETLYRLAQAPVAEKVTEMPTEEAPAYLTRGEVAEMVCELMGDTSSIGSDMALLDGYSDIDKASDYAASLAFMLDKGYYVGDTTSKLRPGDYLTNAELAAVVYKITGVQAVSGGVAFTDTQGHWANDIAFALVEAGYYEGKTMLLPGQPASYTEVADMLCLALAVVPAAA